MVGVDVVAGTQVLDSMGVIGCVRLCVCKGQASAKVRGEKS